jgi:hypothetical protein
VADYYGGGCRGDAAADLRAYASAPGLPIGVVALCGETLCGVAALRADSIPGRSHLVLGREPVSWTRACQDAESEQSCLPELSGWRKAWASDGSIPDELVCSCNLANVGAARRLPDTLGGPRITRVAVVERK